MYFPTLEPPPKYPVIELTPYHVPYSCRPPPIDYRMFYPQVPLTPAIVADRDEDEAINEDKRIRFNSGYLLTGLGIFRILLILSLAATVVASALIVNRDWAVRQESSYDVSVWLSTLVFSCVGLALSLLTFTVYLLNIPNLAGSKSTLFNIMFGVLDLMWFPAMFILGAFCAKREADNHPDFKNMSLNQGAFGVTAVYSPPQHLSFLTHSQIKAFSMLTGFLFMASAIIGFISK